jgi:thymidylate synthase (FAD)
MTTPPSRRLPGALWQFTEPIPVLDKGHVRLVDVMGNDTAIVQAARVSYGLGISEHQWENEFCQVCGIETTEMGEGDPNHCRAGDRRLIRHLMSNRHTTPFEMCEIKLHVRVPMDAWRQWIRHRTASVNEFSTRYSEVPLTDRRTGTVIGLAETDELYWRAQSTSNKQGSGEFLDHRIGAELTRGERELHTALIRAYENRISVGVSREQARKDLPLSTYTEAYWKTDLHNLFHFLSLRMDSHAQLEIRMFAEQIADIVKVWCPFAWEAFEDYRLEGQHFSRMEMSLLLEIIGDIGSTPGVIGLSHWDWPNVFDEHGGLETKRERAAFLRKLGVIS